MEVKKVRTLTAHFPHRQRRMFPLKKPATSLLTLASRSAICGQKHYRIFATDNTENTDESQRRQKGCSLPGEIR